MTFEHVGWLVVNILLPFFLPLLGILPFKILPLPPGVEVRFIALVKDGQLCWAAIAMGASALFEYLNASRENLAAFSYNGSSLFVLSLAMFLALGLAAGGAISILNISHPNTLLKIGCVTIKH
ncbi:MAG: hypothetical protein WCG12_09645 [Alcaligenaceae bacterium]